MPDLDALANVVVLNVKEALGPFSERLAVLQATYARLEKDLKIAYVFSKPSGGSQCKPQRLSNSWATRWKARRASSALVSFKTARRPVPVYSG